MKQLFYKRIGWIEKKDEDYMWLSSRPHLNYGHQLHQTDFFCLSLFSNSASTEWWLQTFLREKRDSVFTRCGHSGILMSQQKANNAATSHLYIGNAANLQSEWNSDEVIVHCWEYVVPMKYIKKEMSVSQYKVPWVTAKSLKTFYTSRLFLQ